MRKIIAITSTALAVAFASQPDIANATLQTAPTPPAPAKAPAAPRVEPVVTGKFKLATIPERKTGGRGSPSPYAFDSLEVGEAFGVKNKDKRAMSSIVSNANRKNKSQASDGNGGTQTIVTKSFTAFDVDAELKKQIKGTALEGSTTLVVRTK